MDFINYGVPTDEGKRVLAHLRGQCEMAEARGLSALNGLSGHVAYFYINVFKGGFLTETNWLKSYPNMASAAYSDLMQIEEAQAAQQQEAAEKTRISESLDEVKAALAVALQRIADLEAAQKTPDPVEEPEPEPEAAPVESKKARKAKTEAEPVEVEAETEA